jgi:hypothetical protein
MNLILSYYKGRVHHILTTSFVIPFPKNACSVHTIYFYRLLNVITLFSVTGKNSMSLGCSDTSDTGQSPTRRPPQSLKSLIKETVMEKHCLGILW